MQYPSLGSKNVRQSQRESTSAALWAKRVAGDPLEESEEEENGHGANN